jgi:MFS family permease
MSTLTTDQGRHVSVAAAAMVGVRGRGSRRAALLLLGIVYAVLMLGGTLPIPLYTMWAPKLGFGALTTTLIFAAYAGGTIVALLTIANLSDQVGRRPMLVGAIAAIAIPLRCSGCPTASRCCFWCGSSLAIATGIVTATATAGLRDLDDSVGGSRAGRMATLVNMGGLGLGAIVAGVFAQFITDPTRTVFWAYLLLMAPTVAALWVLPKGSPTPTDRGLHCVARCGRPRSIARALPGQRA